MADRREPAGGAHDAVAAERVVIATRRPLRSLPARPAPSGAATASLLKLPAACIGVAVYNTRPPPPAICPRSPLASGQSQSAVAGCTRLGASSCFLEAITITMQQQTEIHCRFCFGGWRVVLSLRARGFAVRLSPLDVWAGVGETAGRPPRRARPPP